MRKSLIFVVIATALLTACVSQSNRVYQMEPQDICVALQPLKCEVL